ncbi:MAG: Pyridoxine 4-dehydrogenase [Piccolia ochrophora]|nr:MAG: Pyridoxine 4-dehydrogenase [Piccolia ochrophora]
MVQLVGQEVGKTGFGLMGFTWRANPISQEEAIKTMKAAFNAGAVFWNGGEFYGTKDYNSLHLVNAYFTKYPEDADKVVLSIKGGVGEDLTPRGDEAGVRRSVDLCLKLLDGKKSLDLFECARVDPKTPIETTIGVLAQYVKEGKIKGISLSEVKAETVERAAKVHPIAAVEVELSLWATDILQNGVAAACAKHDIPVVAYSPIGRGFLTGQVRSLDDIPEGDFRKFLPRFQPENFSKNLDLVKELQKLAEQKGCTPAQLAISWCISLSGRKGMPVIIPIPGATTEARVQENTKEVTLSDSDLQEIQTILDNAVVIGGRYGGAQAQLIEG